MTKDEVIEAMTRMRDYYKERQEYYLEKHKKALNWDLASSARNSWNTYLAFSDMRITVEDCLKLVREIKEVRK